MAEEIIVSGDSLEHLKSDDGTVVVLPEGFVEVPTGDTFLTRTIKKSTPIVYVHVRWKSKRRYSRFGIIAPEAVVLAARKEAERTKEARKKLRETARARSEAREETRRIQVEAKMREKFPGMPEDEISEVVEGAFEVGSGRVGRNTSLGDAEKINLAVWAHIRHSHTNYDELLKEEGYDRELARFQLEEEIEAIYGQWRKRRSNERPS